ncbi:MULTISPECIES: hypothetical protein [Halomicrobium]|uniref:DUF1648 domain-containing protein n=2 Tax=Halomicrobium mukohataei TaxID=57705 RepID=C7NZ86_HALMD|nr:MULTISPECIES: hypothetical protein [Halomicrobium]ACV46772.1 hypothetical protein Hmuk_0640 [Halomicrobium mukohataei DSM 12286]QCD65279.1 hypothetical protein E5139_06355 [Halomicrobium mukohataei]QFR20085.1 hypothetical protein GBQ70_06350 [Halomicrobium sp. ZPS1]
MTVSRRALPELTSLALVLATVASGFLLAPSLPETMIVGWHFGLDGELSVTRGPRLLGLTLLPALSVTAYLCLRSTRLLLDLEAAVRPRYYEALVHLVLGALAFGQAWLLTVNLQ